MLGFQRRGGRRCENDTLLPKPGPLPHTSQTEATGSLHWVVVRWIIGPVWADSVVEGYPTSVPERDLARSYPAGMAAAAAVEVMDGEVVRRWLSLAADALGRARAAIDALNVFPVPDADTGTNLYRTVVCAVQALAELPPEADASQVWRAASSGALLGACGNSGIIVSQLLRGLADTCGPASPCDGTVVALALLNAAALARAAVHRPIEGTVLTVADAAAL